MISDLWLCLQPSREYLKDQLWTVLIFVASFNDNPNLFSWQTELSTHGYKRNQRLLPFATEQTEIKMLKTNVNWNRNRRENANANPNANAGKESAPELRRNGTESRNEESKNRLSTIYFPSFFLSPAKHDSLWLQKLHNGSIVISIGGGHPVGPQPLW